MKLTKAQLRTLRIADEEGSVIFGGIDATRNVKRHVVWRLAALGLLVYKVPSNLNEESNWILTRAGRALIR